MRSATPRSRWVFVDTSALAAFFVERDEHRRDAQLISARLGSGQTALLTTNLVIAETHALVLSREGRSVARVALGEIDADVEVIRVTEDDEIAGRTILDQYADKDFSLTEAISFAVMDRLRTAFAFDRHFAQYGLDVLTAE